MPETQCPICKRQVPPYEWGDKGPGAPISCNVCGTYHCSATLAQQTVNKSVPDSWIYSAAIREQNEREVTPTIASLIDLRDSIALPSTRLESIDRILLYVDRKIASPNVGIKFRKDTDYPIACARNAEEFSYLLKIAIDDLGYLQRQPAVDQVRLAGNGWRRLADLPRKEIRSNQAFVAMCFRQDLYDVWENGLKPALELTGYIPIRTDRTEFNDKIDDEIIAQIRKSGLLVADFTGQSNGVYLEAGFAKGLGIPVIWTCRDTDKDKLHFDTRQFNHIVWADAGDLKQKLINRIEATLPNRPKAKLTSL